MKKYLIYYAFLLFAASVPAIAQVPKPIPGTYVDDFANVLTTEQILQLNKQVGALERATSVQLAIVLVQALPGEMNIDDYAREIGRTWHVGNANNGLVYVISITQHKQRLEVAKELEGSIPDVTALHILESIKPFLHKGDYFTGLFNMVQQVQLQLKPATAEQKALGVAELKKKEAQYEEFSDQFAGALLGVLIFVGLCWLIWYLVTAKRRREAREYEEESRKSEIKSRWDTRRAYENFKKPAPASNQDALLAGTAGYLLGRESRNDELSHAPVRLSNDDDNGSSSSSSSSDSGNWGSGSSDSGSSFSSDSGFSGGGASSDF